MAIKQTVRFNASAEQIYQALMSGEKFSKVTEHPVDDFFGKKFRPFVRFPRGAN